MFFVLKIGYGLLFLCFLLMSWAIMVKASPAMSSLGNGMITNYAMSLGALQDATDTVQYPPCAFNPLCTCSKTVPDLGIVSCRDVPLTRLPPSLNSSKIFMLRLENNGLRWIEPQLLQATGLYRLQISDNPLPEMPDDSLLGLERSLWELALQRDQLTSVPNRALRYLQKLRLLDLTGNDICELATDSFRGLEGSLQTLILADNSISMIPPGVFSELRTLETLDMRGNNLQTIDATVLPPRLQHLSLADNMIYTMPMAALRVGLRSLDLSYNRITRMFPDPDDEDNTAVAMGPGQGSQGPGQMGGRPQGGQMPGERLALDVLRMEYNQITELPEASFRSFSLVNMTFMDGNPITVIHDNAFREAKIRELSLRDCGLSHLPANVFSGLEQSLHYLDLSANNLTVLPPGVLGNLQNLRGLNLRDNRMMIDADILEKSNPNIQINVKSSGQRNVNVKNHGHNLHKFDISGRDMHMDKDLASMMRSWNALRELSLGKLEDKTLSAEDLQELGSDVEELDMINSGIQSISSHAFQHARGIKKLDLSENQIKTIDDEAFVDIGHSLEEMRIHRGLKMDSFPATSFRPLANVREFDLSGNGIKTIPDSAFHALRGMRRLRLHDNHIGRIPKGLFQPELHSYLDEVDISFNSIDHLFIDSFSGLTSLRQIRLDDNKIGSIEKKAFTDLPRLRRLKLRGNRIVELNPETFQNLPELEELDIAYNKLTSLDLSALDQVGTLASLNFNASHNMINELRPYMGTNYNNNMNMGMGMGGPGSMGGPPAVYHSNVKVIDLSYNNISEISGGYFRPIEVALTYLLLSHNSLTNATREAFGNMPHLQWLDLSFNDLKELDFDAFRHTRRLQVLYLQYNDLTEIPADAFHGLNDLRVVSLAHNRLKQIPDGILFSASYLERLDVSNNQLTRVPVGSFSAASGRSLCELDLSHNLIAALHPTDAVNRLKSLTWLDLSHNRLTRLDDATFIGMPRLSGLDLSYNPLDEMALQGPLAGLDSSPRLLELGLAGLGLDSLPSLPPLPALRELNAQENLLPTLPSDLAANLTGLRCLDVRDNSLNTLGQVGHGGGLLLPQLRTLLLSGNPLGLITDGCLAMATRLGELDLRNLTQLTAMEHGSLSRMSNLRTLYLGTYNSARDFNIPRVIRHNYALKNLYIEVDTRENDLGDKMVGTMPVKVQEIHLSGRSLKSVSTNILHGVRSPQLHFSVHNTSMEKLEKAMFIQMGRVRNLTLDVRNNSMKHLANPNSAEHPNAPRTTFLLNLQMSGNKWKCDCELGWVETWQRKKRQFLCPGGDRRNCEYGAEDDMRDSTCENKSNQTLIEVLKNDLECGWSSANSMFLTRHWATMVPALLISAISYFMY